MKSAMIMISTINEVKDFVNTISRYDFEIDLISGRYVVDAKSIMGIFSLDLSKPIKLEANCADDGNFLKEISRFIVK